MTLDEGQQRDLVGLVTGLGNTLSDARAHQLLKGSADARVFRTQLDTLGEALRPETPERLPSDIAAQLAVTIRERAGRRTGSRAEWFTRKLQPWLAIAACLLIVVGGSLWFSIGRSHSRRVATALLIPGAVQLSDNHYLEIKHFRPGDLFSSGKGWAVLKLGSGGRLALSPETELRIDGARSVTLDSGQLYYEGDSAITVATKGGAFLLQGEAALKLLPSQDECSVFRGSASIDMAGRRESLKPGESIVWSGLTATRLFASPPPAWAKEALNTASGILK